MFASAFCRFLRRICMVTLNHFVPIFSTINSSSQEKTRSGVIEFLLGVQSGIRH